jgi:hypothetical protein
MKFLKLVLFAVSSAVLFGILEWILYLIFPLFLNVTTFSSFIGKPVLLGPLVIGILLWLAIFSLAYLSNLSYSKAFTYWWVIVISTINLVDTLIFTWGASHQYSGYMFLSVIVFTVLVLLFTGGIWSVMKAMRYEE